MLEQNCLIKTIAIEYRRAEIGYFFYVFKTTENYFF